MLVLHIEGREFFDNEKEMFFHTDPITVKLEHSLISISNWEAKWNKPYLPSIHVDGISGYEEELDYIRCMIIGNVNSDVPKLIMEYHLKEVQDYIENPNSASNMHWIGKQEKLPKQTVTSELIYYWMIRYGIPFSCEKWHFNRLLKLIEVCNYQETKNSKGNKMSHYEAAQYRHELNKKRLGMA